MQAKKTDRIKAAEASLKVLLEQPMKETSKLIKQAQTEYDGMYSVDTQVYFIIACSLSVPELMILSTKISKTSILLFFPALPPEARIHNLLSLAVKDTEITDKPESAGSSLLVQHQKLLLEHFGHKHMAVLPEAVIQHLLLGVNFSPILIVCSSVNYLLQSFEVFTFYLISSFASYFSDYLHAGIGTASRAESDQTKTRCPLVNECGIGRHSMQSDSVIVRVHLQVSEITGVKGVREGAGGAQTPL